MTASPAALLDEVPMSIPNDRPSSWQMDRVPTHAISVDERLPPFDEDVVGWLADPIVAIYGLPAIVRRTSTNTAGYDNWSSGVPGNYIDLRLHRWRLTHWLPLDQSVRQP